MAMDLVIRNARIADAAGDSSQLDIGIANGRIAALAPGLPGGGAELDIGGRFISPGLIETHLHLDKSRILDRCSAPAKGETDYMERVAAVKPGFTEEDVYQRARTTLEQCILQGTTTMRSHVEVDPNVNLRGFDALQQLARDYRWAIDLELCVFAQEGWSGVPEVNANLVEGLRRGASVIGGAPGFDTDHAAQIHRIFALAREFDVDIDIHLDMGHTTHDMDIHLVCDLTEQTGWGGRVAIGHGTKYSCLPPDELEKLGRRLAGVGVTVTVLPATDLFSQGRHQQHSVLRGVADANALLGFGVNCCLSTNNVLNPFTPFGDGSLMRIANLYAHVVQRGTPRELRECFEMMTRRPAQLMGLKDYGIATGHTADLVVWDAASPEEAVATASPALYGFKGGRRTFTRPLPELHRP